VLEVVVDGPLVLNDAELMVQAALDGIGLAYAFEDHVAPHLAAGRLMCVLEDWCPPFPDFFLYYPSRRQMSAALAALVSTLRVA
jgi:DNA-binding transcriptional LysR family regulator